MDSAATPQIIAQQIQSITNHSVFTRIMATPLQQTGSIGLQTGRPGFDARCHQIPLITHSTCSLNQWSEDLGAESQAQGNLRIFPSPPFHAEIAEVEIVVSPSIVPLRNFTELISTVTCICSWPTTGALLTTMNSWASI
ncbi:hypothetical protein TNCV_4130191 [Trichonephila clavipes]|nr:hypothetical protein TNCV_4130191 [Trichonephila clavipes]